MDMGIALALHLLAAVVWVGGMFFAFVVLRPTAATALEAPDRLRLWSAVLAVFLRWVMGAITVLLLTGYWMLFGKFGGFAGAAPYIHIMHGLGLIMVAVFGHTYSAPFKRMAALVANSDWEGGAQQLAKVRGFVAGNLALGIIILVVVAVGRSV